MQKILKIMQKKVLCLCQKKVKEMLLLMNNDNTFACSINYSTQIL